MNPKLLAWIGVCLVLTACSTFRPVKDETVKLLLEAAVPARTPTATRPALAVATPALPPYLDRQQLVTRIPEGQLKVHEFHLWSEPLGAGIARAIAENLRRLTNSNTIQPVGDFITTDYHALIEMQIAQFDPDANGVLVLRCTWKVQPISGTPTSFRTFRTEVPITTTAPLDGRVAAMNEALARLSRVIAASL